MVSRCEVCAVFEKRGVGNAPAVQIKTHRPNRKIFCDCIGPLPQSAEGHSYVFLTTDGYSRYVTGKALHNIDGPNIVRALKLMYISLFSYPTQIVTDGGLSSVPLKTFCEVNAIDLTFISVYHPVSNLQERSNQSLKKILYKLYYSQDGWDETTLGLTIFLYNISVHSTTGYSPYFLFIGRKPEVPLDLFLNTVDCKELNQLDYLKDLNNAIANVTQNAFDAFSKSLNLSARRNNLRNSEFYAGQRILLRNFRKSNKFEQNFLSNYQVVRRLGLQTYMVKNNITNRYSKVNIKDMKADKNHPDNVDTPHEGGETNDENYIPNDDDTDSNKNEVNHDNENENETNHDNKDENEANHNNENKNEVNHNNENEILRFQ